MWTHWEEGQRNPGDLPKSTLWGSEVRSEFTSRAEGMLSKQRWAGLASTLRAGLHAQGWLPRSGLVSTNSGPRAAQGWSPRSGLVSTNSDPSNEQMSLPGGNAQF